MLLLPVLALLLAGPGPRWMARFTGFRRSPGPALVAWQAVGLSAVLSALLVGPAALINARHGDLIPDVIPVFMPVLDQAASDVIGSPATLAIALAISGITLILLLMSGHRVGTGLRTLRRRHRELVDMLAAPGGADAHPSSGHGHPPAQLPAWVRILEDVSPTAYCLPGLRQRLVLSRGTLAQLTTDELNAVLVHEQAHLRNRHDLLLEFFTVLHHTVPAPLRCGAALSEVHLLVEALADRAALRQVGARPLARALVTMAESRPPDASLGSGTDITATRVRLELIAAAAQPARMLTTIITAFAVAVLASPWLLLLSAL